MNHGLKFTNETSKAIFFNYVQDTQCTLPRSYRASLIDRWAYALIIGAGVGIPVMIMKIIVETMAIKLAIR